MRDVDAIRDLDLKLDYDRPERRASHVCDTRYYPTGLLI